MAAGRPGRVFFSYSHADEAHRLEKGLAMLKRPHRDVARRIVPGEQLDRIISTELESARRAARRVRKSLNISGITFNVIECSTGNVFIRPPRDSQSQPPSRARSVSSSSSRRRGARWGRCCRCRHRAAGLQTLACLSAACWWRPRLTPLPRTRRAFVAPLVGRSTTSCLTAAWSALYQRT